MKSVLESADSAQESADSSADPAEIAVWVRAFSVMSHVNFKNREPAEKTWKMKMVMEKSWNF